MILEAFSAHYVADDRKAEKVANAGWVIVRYGEQDLFAVFTDEYFDRYNAQDRAEVIGLALRAAFTKLFGEDTLAKMWASRRGICDE